MTWWRSPAALFARDGALVGLAGTAAFFLLHAAIVEPIWRALPRGLVLGPAAGALLGLAYGRLQREPHFRHPLGGALLGGFAGLALAPFALVGWMRARGAPDPFWLLILALLVTSLYHATQAVQQQPGRARRLELFAAILGANAVAIYFLTFISDFHDPPVEPFAMVAAVAIVYLGAGFGLTVLRDRRG